MSPERDDRAEQVSEIGRNHGPVKFQSRSAYESLVDSLPLSVLIKDAEGRRLFANRKYLEFRGLTLAELVGKRDQDLFSAEVAQQYTADDRQVIREAVSLHSVEQSINAEGDHRWIERVKSPIFDEDGNPIGVQLYFWDVTDRVQADLKLRHEKDLLAMLMKHLPDSIYFKDQQSRFVRISEAMAEKFGLPNAKAAEGLTDADIFSREHAHDAREDELRIMQSRQPLVDRIERETWPDRDDSWCLSTKMPMVNDQGEVAGTFGISRDITELKQSQDDLLRARDVADQANRAKSEFLANMSHEIRTPMNAIIGMSELLALTKLDDEQRDYVELVRDSSDSLLRLLNDILDFSKIEARKLEIESIPFSVSELIEKTPRTLSLRAKEKGIEVSCQIDSELPERLLGDPGRLRQVLINLINNAIKFTDEGTVSVIVDGSQITDDTWNVRFEVCDTGIGIPENKRSAVLEAFGQADASTTRRFGGTGLGLAISIQLVELMSGKLDFKSEVGSGTNFFFTIPFAVDHSDDELQTVAEEFETKVAIKKCPMLRVLVAEDGLANQHVAVGLLKAAGHQAVVASDGRETIARWRNEPFDVILMDMHMPVMDGIEATQQIRAEEHGTEQHIPIIAITAAAMKEDAELCRQAGMDDYMAKPIHPRQLQAKLAKLFGRTSGRTTVSDSNAKSDSDLLQTSGSSQRLAERLNEASRTIDLRAAAARVPGGLTGVRRLAEVFLVETESIMQTLSDQIPSNQVTSNQVTSNQVTSINASSRDATTIARAAHTLKGSAALFYATGVYEVAEQLERQARSDDLASVPAIIEKLREEIQPVIRELRNFLDLTSL